MTPRQHPTSKKCRAFRLLVQLREDALDDLTLYVGQAKVAALEAVGEFLMIDAEETKHCGMQIVHFDDLPDRTVSELVGRAIGQAAFDSRARHPDGKARNVMVAA